jgi:hypothetical protein
MRYGILVSRPLCAPSRRNARAGSPSTPHPAARFPRVRASMVHSHRRTVPIEQVTNSRKFRQKPEAAGTNTRSAPRRHARRRSCCSLCSARARSGPRSRQLPGASVGGLAWSLRYFLRPPCSPPPESLHLPSPTPNRSDWGRHKNGRKRYTLVWQEGHASGCGQTC